MTASPCSLAGTWAEGLKRTGGDGGQAVTHGTGRGAKNAEQVVCSGLCLPRWKKQHRVPCLPAASLAGHCKLPINSFSCVVLRSYPPRVFFYFESLILRKERAEGLIDFFLEKQLRSWITVNKSSRLLCTGRAISCSDNSC